MPYPGYMLNPGDMFQVEPSSVMFATGAPKTRTSNARKVAKEKAAARAEARESTPQRTTSPKAELVPTRTEPTPTELKTHMQALMVDVESVLNEDVGAKDKQKFRSFRQTVKKAVGLWKTASPETVSTLDAQFSFLRDALKEKQAAAQPESSRSRNAPTEPVSLISEEDEKKLRKAFEKLRLEAEHTSAWNKRDASAPYATPWRPRDYMSAFAFIPRYLEVNQNICAAVYLRHPVARPGLAEVPTPFHLETGQLAFNWYLRRR
jgi:ribosomal protein S4